MQLRQAAPASTGASLSDYAISLGASSERLAALDAALVQAQRAIAGAAAADDADIKRAALGGVSGSGGALPYQDRIQASFGRHDVSAIQAYSGGAASAACETMGAHGYAVGDAVAFRGTPSLHTAAHEAAHVVQQRAGISLKGGVGQAGDAHEVHADAVADRVVAGQSAEALLDRYSGSGGGSAVQLHGDGEHSETAEVSGWAGMWSRLQTAPEARRRPVIQEMIAALAQGLRPPGEHPWAGSLAASDVVMERDGLAIGSGQAAVHPRLVFRALVQRPTSYDYWRWMVFNLRSIDDSLVRANQEYSRASLIHELQHCADMVHDFRAWEASLGRAATPADGDAFVEYQRSHGGSAMRHQEIYELQAEAGEAAHWTDEEKKGWINGLLNELPLASGDPPAFAADAGYAAMVSTLQSFADRLPTGRRAVQLFQTLTRESKLEVQGTLFFYGNTTTPRVRSWDQWLRRSATALAQFAPIWLYAGGRARHELYVNAWRQKWLRFHRET